MAKTICVSFKENSAELKLYEYLKSKTSPSTFVKELVEQYINGNLNSSNNRPVETQNQLPKKSNIKGLASIIK